MRKVVLRNADESSSFMKTDTLCALLDERIDEFINDLDSYPIHFALHLCHAAEIVGYQHPDFDVKKYWHLFYREFCNAFHMNIETKGQLSQRLADNL